MVKAAAVMGDIIRKISLPSVANITAAELQAVRLALGEAVKRTAEFVPIPYRDWFPLMIETTLPLE